MVRFLDEFKNSYVYHTNAIKGNPVTEYDTAYIIQSNHFLEDYSAKDNMEVLGSSKAWDYVQKQPEYILQTILQIHKLLMWNMQGYFARFQPMLEISKCQNPIS